jgi:16S rRNA (guanine966-N2)-methyltransferase
MRIIAGKYRSTPLAPVGKGDEAVHLRPTTDRVRESLFNVLAGGRFDDPLDGARVLDLFAGTGALGLEALSRGAERVCFVENGRAGYKLISKNIAKLRAAEDTTLLTYDATNLPDCPYDPFTLIFLDPPYGKGLGERALDSARKSGWIAKDALIIWEDNEAQIAPKGFELVDTKSYGTSHMTLLRST